MNRGAWWATVWGCKESDMTEQLSTHTLLIIFGIFFISSKKFKGFRFRNIMNTVITFLLYKLKYRVYHITLFTLKLL